MPEKGVRNNHSQSPFQIYNCDDQGVISTGTAFFYLYKETHFLITNWHNITGKHFITKEKLGPRLPTYIEAKLCTNINNTDQFTTIAHRIEIYKDYEPLWFEHPLLQSNCDVIALPFPRPNNLAKNMNFASNIISKIKIPIMPGNPIFIIGFPKSISVGFGLPLWKSGYIASEPYYDISIGGKISNIGGLLGGQKLPAFFIDTQTREGMSGSPVFASYTGNWSTKNPYEKIDPSKKSFWIRDDIALGENRMEFVGCYSGRIGKIEDGAALGLCWRTDTIDAICEAKQKAKHPHISDLE